jgi:hypothetical protein
VIATKQQQKQPKQSKQTNKQTKQNKINRTKKTYKQCYAHQDAVTHVIMIKTKVFFPQA